MTEGRLVKVEITERIIDKLNKGETITVRLPPNADRLEMVMAPPPGTFDKVFDYFEKMATKLEKRIFKTPK
jgi:hypothetical protein